MDLFENIISALDVILDSERKRHITGGILLSASATFQRTGYYGYDYKK